MDKDKDMTKIKTKLSDSSLKEIISEQDIKSSSKFLTLKGKVQKPRGYKFQVKFYKFLTLGGKVQKPPGDTRFTSISSSCLKLIFKN
jgi:hypothetical protein